jgi:hypothetical protein
MAEPNVDVGIALQGFAQQSFEPGLIEEVARRPTEAAAGILTLKLADRPAIAPQIDRTAQGPRGGRNRLTQADRLKYPHDLGVEVDCAWQVIRLEAALDHERAESRLPAQVRGNRSHGAHPDNGYIELLATCHLRPRFPADSRVARPTKCCGDYEQAESG